MDIILNIFFQNFAQLERDTLHARYKRRSMVEYLTTVITGCSKAEECNPKEVCHYAVISIIRYHQLSLKKNGWVCKMGKYHNILYVAVKLCYTWQLDDATIVGSLLDNIYACEKSFDRIWLGALFGTNASYIIGGWKSDFDSQEENVQAIVYFLNHANSEKKQYQNEEKTLIRFVDIPLESCGKATPLKIALQLGLFNLFLILLRFGAEIEKEVVKNLVNSLIESHRLYNRDFVRCLNVYLMTVPFINVYDFDSCFIVRHKRKDKTVNRLLSLVRGGILLKKNCMLEPVELKHLCRCVIRKELKTNYCLPNGIGQLDLPRSLEKYLDLLSE